MTLQAGECVGYAELYVGGRISSWWMSVDKSDFCKLLPWQLCAAQPALSPCLGTTSLSYVTKYAMTATNWVNDISITTTKVLTTTGGTVWDAARRCAQFLESEASRIGLDRPGVKVLELGAGCGLLGMLVARNTPAAAEVCLTDQAYGGAVDHLSVNVEANKQLPNMTSITVCACDWTHFMNEQLVQDVINGCCSAGTQQQQQQQQQESQAVQPGVVNLGLAHHFHHHQQQQQQQQDGQQHGAAAACCNAGVGSSSSSSSALTAAELADLHKLLNTRWDIIIGSDLVYNTAGVKGFPRVLAALIPPTCISNSSGNTDQGTAGHASTAADGTSSSCSSNSNGVLQSVMYYAHTKHRFDAMDVDLFAELEGLGFSVEEVVEQGVELPPPSPPPFTTLYPDLRIAMFKISRPEVTMTATA